jgi:glutamate racemase
MTDAAVGIFDSGVGGLSVLRHIHARLPREHLLYFADSGYAPYGERSEEWIVARSLTIADFLLRQGAKALVVACNTATVAAVASLRARYPELPLVGVEPGLKPAAALSRSKVVGVLATDRTLSGHKFLALRDTVATATGARFLLQPCTGLAQAIESGDVDGAQACDLVRRYVAPLIEQGADTLVLGCTHYPFVQHLIVQCAPPGVAIVDTGEAIARQLERLLQETGAVPAAAGSLTAYTTGDPALLEAAFARLLGLRVTAIAADCG